MRLALHSSGGSEKAYSPIIEAEAQSGPRRFGPRGLSLSDRSLKYLMLAPAATVLFGFILYPLAYSFWLSLHRYDLVRPGTFIGLSNYAAMLTDARMLNSLRATLIFAIAAFVIEIVVGFGLALLLAQRIRGRGILRALMVAPLMLTPVVMGINFRLMLNYDFGVVNWFIGLFGVPKVNWITDPVLAMVVLIAVEVWHMTPFSLLIFSAGLESLPQEVLDAADADGANWWQKLRSVTIPMLAPLFLIVGLFRSYDLLRMYDLAYALTSGGPGQVTETLSYQIVIRLVTGWQVGYSCAMSFVLFGIGLLLAIVFIRTMTSTGEAS